MKNTRNIVIVTVILLSFLLMLTFADDITKVIQAVESNTRIIYNGKEVTLGAKVLSIENSNYLPVRASAVLFNKNIDWNQVEQKIVISDKVDTTLGGLKIELAVKDKNILELQDKVKKLEKDISVNKRVSIRELQDKVNEEYSEYEGVIYKVVLSGNEDEIRVKIVVDLSGDKSLWSRLSSSKREEMIGEVCNVVAGGANSAKIKGYVKDISSSRKLATFYSTYEGEVKIGSYRNFSTISTLEEMLNSDYDDYFGSVNLIYCLSGNENRIECVGYIQRESFEGKWERISDSGIKNFAKKLCSVINKEFENCNITGFIYDTDSSSELAVWEQAPDGEFAFSREQQ